MPVGTFLMILLFVAFVAVVGVAVANRMGMTPSGRESRDKRELREKLDRAETLIEELRETAYQHRELDSTLSTIICDDISTYYRRNRELER